MQRLCSGVFSWDREERVSGRYGFVYPEDHDFKNTFRTIATYDSPPLLHSLEGKQVRIVCEVISTRKSGHVGDQFLKIYPVTPQVGEKIELGVGKLELRESDWCDKMMIGLSPSDGRTECWYNPHVLYKLHDQEVVFYIEETTDPDSVFEIPKPKTDAQCIALEDGFLALREVDENNCNIKAIPKIEKIQGMRGTFTFRMPNPGEEVDLLLEEKKNA